MKKVVYTVLLGDYTLNEPKYLNKDWSLICFTDQDIVSKNWLIVKVKCEDTRKKSREIKIRCDKFIDFDICLYLDAKFVIKCNLDRFIKNNLRTNIALMKHNKRACAYDEARFCIDIGKDSKESLLPQIEAYRKAGFPENFGLYAPGIMIRRNTPKVINFMKMWYDEVDKYSYRDQVSFAYTLWKNPIELSLMPFKETYARFK